MYHYHYGVDLAGGLDQRAGYALLVNTTQYRCDQVMLLFSLLTNQHACMVHGQMDSDTCVVL